MEILRVPKETLKKNQSVGAPGWLSRLSPTLDFGSGYDLRVMELNPLLGSILGMELTLKEKRKTNSAYKEDD